MDLFTTEQLKNLNDLELEIYKYVRADMAKIDKMKIRELANELHCSTTTILRFCRKLDCNGYTEFKLKLKMLQSGKSVDLSSYYVPIEKRSDHLTAHDVTTQVPVVYLIEKLGKEVYKLIKEDGAMEI